MGNAKTSKFHQLKIFYHSKIWCNQYSNDSMVVMKSSNHSSLNQGLKFYVHKIFSGNCSLLLSFEVANHVLVDLPGATIQEDMLTYNNDEEENFPENDLSLISYLGGYVYETFYRRIHCSTKVLPAMFIISDGKRMYWWECYSSRTKIFCRRYFEGPKFFLMGISWVQNCMTFNKL